MANEIKMKNAIELAFVGDAVYELLVREHIASKINAPTGKLHTLAVKYVRADAQCSALEKINPYLSDEELDIVRRGKNASKTSVPKNGSPKTYRSATGLEALFGYLFLMKDMERIFTLFGIIIDEDENGREPQ